MGNANSWRGAKTLSNMCHSSELAYLAPEVGRQILANLPVQTLLRFRCVCKTWCSIIDHPDFSYTHLTCRKVDSNKTTIFALEKMGWEDGKACLFTVYRGNILEKTVIFLKSSALYCVIGRCNELVLIERYVRHRSGDYEIELMLCNPSIRKLLLIPPCPIGDFTNLMYVLGFAPCSKDYKVVSMTFKQNGDEKPAKMRVAVYTLSDQQWSVRNYGVDIKHGLCYFAPVAFYFEAAAYWFAKDGLVSLNFDSEKITYMEIPNALNEQESERFLFLLGNSLAIFSFSRERSEIWVMEQEQERGQGNGVWTKWLSGRSDSDTFYLLSCPWPSSNVIYYESDDGRCLIWGNKLYNIDTCRVKVFEKSMGGYWDSGMYMESLVLFNVDGVEDMTSSPEIRETSILTATKHRLRMFLGRRCW